MSDNSKGENKSLWIATTNQTAYPTLKDDSTTYDCVVIGGGITGIATAYLLQKRGLRVAIIEKNRIVEWTTGETTAKLSSQHYLIYDYLIKRHGESVAAAFAKANVDGIDEVERLSKELGIDCDFSRRDAYVFSNQADKTEAIKDEVAAAKQLGLPANFKTSTDLPFDVTAAIKFSNQAQFHPRKFLLPLAEHFVDNGGVIYEHTEATDIKPGEPHTIVTKHGNLRAKSIVQASGEPFWHKELLEGRMWSKMSYALAVTLKDNTAYPKSMYITTDKPLRTIRSAPFAGKMVMIFGGESHEYDEENFDENLNYQNLIDDVHRRFDVDAVLYRWLAGDYMPYDRIPYIGPDPDYNSIYIATGYRAWGLAWAMSAARGITSYLQGEPAEWIKPFSLDRLKEPLRPEDKEHGI